ncbi:MAG: fructose transport system substrate-binding protein [Actinomycetota bacterium]|nr:fructose transport system substrate-binding protein [Actinomycetota bacterium]
MRLNDTRSDGYRAGRRRHRVLVAVAISASATMFLAACSSSNKSGSAASTTAATTASAAASGTASAATGKTVGVALILKTLTNPFFVSMQKDAEAAAAKIGVKLTVSAGKQDGDEPTQITAIENAVSAGDKGILITPNGPGVNPAIGKARAAGLYVIALDTPPDPASTVDITFATDNLQAGKLIGQWTAKTLAGKSATIAMLDLFNDKIVSVDVNRDHGFLTGMGIPPGDASKNGGEAKSGKYSGGSYSIACHEATQGAEDGGRTAMENCLSKNPGINVVYTINEPAANGAYQALKAAGKTSGVLVVSIDGGCSGVNLVKQGVINATSQQYPGKMASLGVQAIADLVAKGTKPSTSTGLDFFNTGVQLITAAPAAGVTSISVDQGLTSCWGSP